MEKVILFYPQAKAQLLEMLPLIQEITKKKLYTPAVCVDSKTKVLLATLISNHGLKTVHDNGGRNINAQEKNNKSSSMPLAHRISSLTRKGVEKILSWIHFFLVYKKKQRHAYCLLNNHNVVLVVLISDRILGLETALVWAANRLNIPSVIVPFALSFPDAPAQQRLRDPYCQRYIVRSFFDKIIAYFFPKLTYTYQETRLFFYTLSQSLGALLVGMMPNNPWSLGGGNARGMAVESEFVRDAFIKQGISIKKMCITGKPSADQISQNIDSVDCARMRKNLGAETKQKVILCSVPQLGEHGLLPWDTHWNEVEFLFSSLSKNDNVRVVASLHPKSDPNAYRPLAKKYNIHITDERIYTVLPICDIFVATFSSTVMQAASLGKPTLVVDFYSLGYKWFDSINGIKVLRDKTEFMQILNMLCCDTSFYNEVKEKLEQQSSYFALFDKKCTERTLEYIHSFIASS